MTKEPDQILPELGQDPDQLVPDESAFAGVTDDQQPLDLPVRRTRRLRLYVRRFWRNKPAVIGLAFFILLVLLSAVGGKFTPFSYTDMDFTALGAPPGTPGLVSRAAEGIEIEGPHLLGTDSGGIDVLAMLTHGIGRSMIIALSVALLTTLFAAFISALAAYLAGITERIVLAIINFLLILPSFLLMALIANHYSGAWQMLIVVMVVFGWMYPARVIWSLSTSVRERDYIAAARFMGARGTSVVIRHMVPNIGSLLVIQFTLGVVGTVMAETGLSFLGFGVKIPDVSLGTMLQSGVSAMTSTPWLFWVSAGTLTLLTVSVALISDGLRDALDPNSAAGGRA